jgi:hypothetical protein
MHGGNSDRRSDIPSMDSTAALNVGEMLVFLPGMRFDLFAGQDPQPLRHLFSRPR